MKIGLSCDLKEAVLPGHAAEDALEEYDSVETVEIIRSSLEEAGHTVVMLGGGAEFLQNVTVESVDIVFNIAEGRGSYRSREAQVPSVLEMLDFPYSGSDPQCLAVCLDKPVTKQLVTLAGVPTPRWLLLKDKNRLAETDWRGFPFPAIIKPAYEGSSKGIRATSLVESPARALDTAGRLLEVYRQPVLVEEFIDGDEVTVGLVGTTPKVLGVMRILPRQKDGPFLYSLEVKRDWERLVDYECPARLSDETVSKITDYSLKAFEALECRDFARIDFRVKPDGSAYFIEINPLPGLGTYSDLVIMAKKLGWTHGQLIRAVFEGALRRYPQFVCV